MITPKDNKSSFTRLKTKKCKRPGCTNYILNHKNKEYCSEARCAAFRDMEKYGTKGRPGAIHVYPKTINVIIPRKKRLSGTIIHIQCSAEGPNGRCEENTDVRYMANKSRYPKFCRKHRNEYKRKRFEEGLLR
jgi:hypothetical protein